MLFFSLLIPITLARRKQFLQRRFFSASGPSAKFGTVFSITYTKR